jgi:hypothetical protein
MEQEENLNDRDIGVAPRRPCGNLCVRVWRAVRLLLLELLLEDIQETHL